MIMRMSTVIEKIGLNPSWSMLTYSEFIVGGTGKC